jgi:rSAM/selenodomain-associated transferase 2
MPVRTEPTNRISIIIPVLNESAIITGCLTALQALRQQGHELIVVDGASHDDTVALARPLTDKIITTMAGRAAQMNKGAQAATNDTLLFLHADTRLPPHAGTLIMNGLLHNNKSWGRFNVQFSGRHPLLSIVATLMNIRSRFTGIATGDQAIFIQRRLFESAHGFPAIAIMEDIALSRQLLRHGGRPLCLIQPVTTSSRRWEQHGILRTIILMWYLRLAYYLGTPPSTLAKKYP